MKPVRAFVLGVGSKTVSLLRQAAASLDVAVNLESVASLQEALKAAEEGDCVVVIVDASAVPPDEVQAIPSKCALLVISQQMTAEQTQQWVDKGALDTVCPLEIPRLKVALHHMACWAQWQRCDKERGRHSALSDIVQRLSMARTMEQIMAVVRRAARDLTGAQGAAFILREGDTCYYADEDAISPLWKGQRFPVSGCIGGLAMLERRPVSISNALADSRVPTDAYVHTFVRSLVVVPIRTLEPLGAIGVYWDREREPLSTEVELLQSLANATSLAIENVQFQEQLERRVAERTVELERANEELDAFARSVSHDLRNRLNRIHGFASLAELRLADHFDDDIARYLAIVKDSSHQMLTTISDLMTLSKAGRQQLHVQRVDVTALCTQVIADLRRDGAYDAAEVTIAEGMVAVADPRLLQLALNNILANALKYSATRERPLIEIGISTGEKDSPFVEFYVRDNGVGFDATRCQHLFKPFVRLHDETEFPGTGVGLTIVHRVIERHGGQARIQGQVGKGVTLFFSLPTQP